MKIITKIMLALMVVASFSLASCKDYDEDNYTNAMVDFNKLLDQQKADMTKAITELQSDVAKNAATIKTLNDQINSTDGIKAQVLKNQQVIADLSSSVDALKNSEIPALQTRLDDIYILAKADSLCIEDLYDITDDLAGEISKVTDLPEAVDEMSDRIDALEDRVEALEDARAKQITGITINQVYNPAYGSYNSLATNVKTNMLVAYYGTANSGISFPSVDPKYTVKSGATLLGDEGNAGTLYLTINPTDVDFDGFTGLKLVNSQDEECAIKLGDVTPSSKTLTSGYTRAASSSNGFYEVPATLAAEDLNNSDLHLNIDKSGIKTALKELITTSSKAEAKVALKDIAKVAFTTAEALQLPAQGVKCSWKDTYGEHSVVSDYDMTALAVAPLGFYSADGLFEEGGAYWRSYDKVKTLISNTATKITSKISTQLKNKLNLDKLSADISNIQGKLTHINDISMDGTSCIINTDVTIPAFDVPISLDVTVGDQNVTVEGQTVTTSVNVPTTYNSETGNWNYEDKEISVVIPGTTVPVEGQTIHIEKTITVAAQTASVTIDITDQINDIFGSLLGDVNGAFHNVNSLMDALSGSLDDVNTMLDAINNLESSLNSASYLSTIYSYMDKLANGVAKVTPKLFKPVLLVNSDKGFGLAGFKGAPSTVSGNVTVYPTTYSAELLAPIFKKYIRVNGANGQLVTSKSLDITSQLKSGSNTVEFYALDYLGNEYSASYVLNK